MLRKLDFKVSQQVTVASNNIELDKFDFDAINSLILSILPPAVE